MMRGRGWGLCLMGRWVGGGLDRKGGVVARRGLDGGYCWIDAFEPAANGTKGRL